MKKLASLFIALLAIGMVSASVGPVDVECGSGFGIGCNEYELDDEFGTITDYINDNEGDWNAPGTTSTNYYGGGGMDSRGLSRYLTGDSYLFDVVDTFMEYLYVVFATNTALEEANIRIDTLEVKIEQPDLTGYLFNIAVAQKTAARTGETVVTEEGYTCKPLAQSCFKTGE